MDDVVTTYLAAWNEPDPERRGAILQRSLADDAELLDPTGRWQGVDGFVERIGNHQTAAPDTKVVPASGTDAHNDVARYAWTIVDPEGQDIMEGIDVAERATDGRLQVRAYSHGPRLCGPPARARPLNACS